MIFMSRASLRPATPKTGYMSEDYYVAEGGKNDGLGSVVSAGDGDFMGATKLEALRSRVARMISNPPGAYAHIRDFGLQVKQGKLLAPSELQGLQMKARKMLKTDPDIIDANVIATMAPFGIRRVLMLDVEIQCVGGMNISLKKELEG